MFGDLPVKAWDESTGLRSPPLPFTINGVGKRAKRGPVKANRFTPLHVVPTNPEADARRLLIAFATKAFRRSPDDPADESNIAGYIELGNENLHQGACFQEAMRLGFQSILCSPDFLFVKTQSDTPQAFASQLAYFRWNSMPDERLPRSAGEVGNCLHCKHLKAARPQKLGVPGH